MIQWPSSLPDYQWPQEFLSGKRAPQRLALLFLFHAAHLLGRLTSLFTLRKSAVVVIRTDGIGDGVLFEPALRRLREGLPDHEIHLWAPAATCELMERHPALTSCKSIPRGAKAGNLAYFFSALWQPIMGWRLGRNRFDLAIYAVQSPEPLGNWIFRSVRAAEKCYAPGDTENQFDWQQKNTEAAATRVLTSLPGESHELVRNAHFAAQWEAEPDQTEIVNPRLTLGPDAAWHAQGFAEQWRQFAFSRRSKTLVGIMAGSATAANAYPVHSWVQIVRSLWATRKAICIFFGGPDDIERVDEICRQLGDIPHRRVPVDTNLRTTAAAISELDGFISMDTGLAHIALAQEVPTVVIANGGHPNRFFPWPSASHSITLTHPMPCAGCQAKCSLSEPECVTRINPQDVVAAFEEIHQTPAKVAA